MRPGSWTELFFLDEATAFAAGHRPCAYCRRARFNEFKAAWLAANPAATFSATPRIDEIDHILHAERTQKGGRKVTYEEALNALPDGAMIELDAIASGLTLGLHICGKNTRQATKYRGFTAIERKSCSCIFPRMRSSRSTRRKRKVVPVNRNNHKTKGEPSMWQRALLGTLAVVVAYTAIRNLPDVACYIKIRNM